MATHLVVMGVCGCGKTTLATALSQLLGWDYFEADDFHPKANVEKMSAGIPLNDDDRRPWLEKLRDQMNKNDALGKSSIVSCSALKRIYRDLLSKADGDVYFLHIHGSEDLLRERLENRKGHFMPPALLPSQLATLETLAQDEQGTVIPLANTTEEQANIAMKYLTEHCNILLSHLDLVVIGSGVMGAALAYNFADQGFKVGVYDQEMTKSRHVVSQYSSNQSDALLADNLENLSKKLQTPRIFFLVVPAGQATDSAINSLLPYLEQGDIVVDLGNTYFADTQRRERALLEKGIHFAGCGISGGEEGARYGAALMFGGSEHAYRHIKPLLEKVAAKAEDDMPCFARISSDGAGHYVKMIHNGIEYADMQLLAEIYALARENKRTPLEISEIFKHWQSGTLNSYLLDISAQVLAAVDQKTGSAMVDVIDDRAGQKGTGAWTTQNALELGIPVNMIAEATFARGLSGCDQAREKAREIFSSTANIQPYAGNLEQDFEKALITGKILAYAQGFMQIQEAAKKYHWKIDLAELALIWRAGCIIRADILQNIAAAFSRDSELPFLGADPYFATLLKENLPACRKVAAWAMENGIPVPVLSAGLSFFDALRTETLPTALIQGQRDYFGAHSYARRDNKEARFHRLWTEDGKEVEL